MSAAANVERLVADARACGLERESRALWCEAFACVRVQGGSVDDAAVAAELACRELLETLQAYVGRCVRGGGA